MFEGIENKPYYDDWTNSQLDPKSEQFRNAYNSVVNDYGKENADAQLKDWGITLENEIEGGSITPSQLPENSPIKKEAEQLTDNNPNNDEVNNDAVEDFLKQMEAGQPPKKDVDSVSEALRSNYAKDLASNIAWNEARDSGIRGKSSGREEELQEEMLNDENFQPDLNDINRLAKAANGLDQTPDDNEQLKQALGESYDDVIEKIENNEDKADANLLASEWLKAQGFSTAKSQNKLINKIGKFLLKEGKFPEVYAGSLENMSARDKNKLLKQGYMAEGRPANRKYGLKSLDEYTKADLENRLKKLKDKSSLENFIEKHPTEAAATLPEGEAKQEAEQIINDNDKRNDEVNNDKIGKFLNSGVNWDKVKVYEPNEDPYSKVTDEYDWKNNPDYESEPIEVGENKDEDFLGPDEYIDENGNIKVDPNWKPENADEDFVGPDEQLAVINDGLPAEVKYEPVYDTDDYNFDWDYAVENVPELRELNDELDAEDKEEIAQLLGFKFGGKPGSLNNPPQDSQATNDIKFNNSNAGLGSIGSGFLGKISSGNVNPSHVGSGVNFNTRMDSVKSIASKAPVPPEAASTSNSKAVAGSNNNLPHSNGTVGSGAGMMFQKRNSDLKVKGSNLPELGGPHHQSEVEETNVDDIIENMSEGLIETLEKMLNEHPELGEQLGFDHKYKHWAFNGITLDELPIDKIISLTNSLRRLI